MTARVRAGHPILTILALGPEDMPNAEHMARVMGFEHTAQITTSDLPGLYCFASDPSQRPQQGCIAKTQELGLLFIATADDIVGEDQ